MNRLSILALVVAIISAAFKPSQNEVYVVDPSASTVEWEGNRVGGGGHKGTISIKEGTMNFEGTNLRGGTFLIDMSTINTTDLTGDRKARLDGHLKNQDFFDINRFPTSSLIIKNVESAGTGRVRITGDLSIKGTTRPIEFPATVAFVGGRVIASASLSFNRADFDVRYGSGRFFDNLGDRAIRDEIPLVINLVATKR